jgi:hypothetical protein
MCIETEQLRFSRAVPQTQRKTRMLRKTLLGLTAALALGTAALASTAASAGPNFSIQIGGFDPNYC